MESNNEIKLFEVEFYKKAVEFIKKYKVIIISVSLFLALAIVSFFSYKYYKRVEAQEAHKTLVNCMKYYDAPVLKNKEKTKKSSEISFDNETDKWVKVEQVFEEAYKKHSSSSLSGIFLAFVSEAMLRAGKRTLAEEVLLKSIGKINNSVLKSLYEIKYALMLLDNAEESKKSLGLSKLIQYVKDTDSVVHDEVLYNLGLHYWYSNNFDESKNYWNQLIHKYGPGTKDPSPWVSLAKEKLKLIVG